MADDGTTPKVQILLEAVNATKAGITETKAELQSLRGEQAAATAETAQQEVASRKLNDTTKKGAGVFSTWNKQIKEARKGARDFKKALALGAAILKAADDINKFVKAVQAMNKATAQSVKTLAQSKSRLEGYRETARSTVEEMRNAGEVSAEMADSLLEAADRINSSDSLRKFASKIRQLRREITGPKKQDTELLGVNLDVASARLESLQTKLDSLGDTATFKEVVDGFAAQREAIDQVQEAQRRLTEAELVGMEAKRRADLEERISANKELRKSEIAKLRADEEVAINDEKNRIIHAENLRFGIQDMQQERALLDAKKALTAQYIEGTSQLLANAAATAEAFGEEGFVAFKAFQIAQATVNTYSAAVGAYNSMVGIPYVGPVLAVIAAAAAVAAGIAQIANIAATSPSGYAEGGLIPGAPSTRDNRLAFVATGEFVIPADVVKRWGASHFEAYRRGRAPWEGRYNAAPSRGPGFASGGLVGRIPASTASAASTQLAVINTREDMRRFQEREGTRIVVDQLRRRGNRVRA